MTIRKPPPRNPPARKPAPRVPDRYWPPPKPLPKNLPSGYFDIYEALQSMEWGDWQTKAQANKAIAYALDKDPVLKRLFYAFRQRMNGEDSARMWKLWCEVEWPRWDRCAGKLHIIGRQHLSLAAVNDRPTRERIRRRNVEIECDDAIDDDGDDAA